MSLAFRHSSVSPVWPPTGLALAAILLGGYSLWPAIALGALLTNLFVSPVPFPVAIGIAAGNTLEALVGAWLFRRWVGPARSFEQVQSLFKFLGFSVLIPTALSATIGVLILSIGGHARWADFGTLWLTWWLGDAMGALIFTPAILSWVESSADRPKPGRVVEVFFLFLLMCGVLLFTELGAPAHSHLPIWHLIFPILVCAALRTGQRGVTICLLLLTVVTVWLTLHHRGPFVGGKPNEALLFLQLFIASATITALALATAVAENKRARIQLQDQASQLERSNEELERYALVASHDLREPLRMITSYAELLKKRYRDRLEVDGNEFLGRVLGSAERLRQLVDDLLEFAKLELPTRALQPADTGRALQQAIENLRMAIQEGEAEIQFGDLPVLPTNLPLLVQVFQNLIGNAIKFRGDAHAKVEIQAYKRERSWTFSIRDYGIGFEPEQAESIFGLFKRLNSSSEYSGSGIGLATCKKIVERHGGKIWARSEPGKGATFFFTLPDQVLN